MDWSRYYGGDFIALKWCYVLNEMEEVRVEKSGVPYECISTRNGTIRTKEFTFTSRLEYQKDEQMSRSLNVVG